MNCVGCNKELLDNAKFCRFCGASQTIKPQPVITPTISEQLSTEPACKKCGNVLLANAKFCKHCGESTNSVTPTPPPAASTAPPPPVTSIKTNQNTTNDNQTPVNNLAVPKNKNWLIPTLILFTVFIISALVYVLKFSGESDATQPAIANTQNIPKVEAPVKTEGLDLKSIVEKIIISNSPIDVVKAFKPCKLKGEGGDLTGDCLLSSDGEFLVDENVEDNRNVSVITSGSHYAVEKITLSAKFPNHIGGALYETKDWSIKEIDCGQDKDDGNHRQIYTAKPSGKNEFVFEAAYSGGAGASWGELVVYLAQISNNKPCDLVDLNLYKLENDGSVVDMVMDDGYGTSGFNGNNYTGQWKNGKANGIGIKTFPIGDVYEGEWKDGKPNGEGTYTYASGTKHVGEFKDGKFIESSSNQSSEDLSAKRPLWCDKAETSVEKMICTDEILSEKDVSLYEVYKKAKALAVDKKDFNSKGRGWLVNVRNACATRDCLIQAYEARSAELESEINSANFKYESAITLHGKLVSAEGEGADEKIHTYPALQLEKAISVLGSDEINTSESGVVLIQLSLNEALFKLYEELIGKDVSVTGTLYHSHTGHHYTSVLMDTSVIKKVDSKSTALNLKPSKNVAESKHQLQPSTISKSKNYQQLFICSSDMNYLPAANTLAKTLIDYYSAGQDVGYQAVMNSSASHFNSSSVGGGCVQHGFKVDELPQGNKVLYAQNDKMLFWLVETKGLGGGAYTAVAEYK